MEEDKDKDKDKEDMDKAKEPTMNLVHPNNCPHFVKSVGTSTVRKAFKAIKKPTCRNCSYAGSSIESKKYWVCLQCGNIACGDFNAQNGEAMKHFETPHSDLHSIVVQLGEEYRCWCFTCQSEVNSKNVHLKEVIGLVKRHVKGTFNLELIEAEKKKVDDSAASIPIISLPPPPLPPAPVPVHHKQYGGKKEGTKGFKNFQSSYNNGYDADKPMGLENLGNTCFMNAALQCLSRTKLLIPKLDLFGSGENIPVLVSQFEEQARIAVLNPGEITNGGGGSGDVGEEGDGATEIQNGEVNLEKPFVIKLDISSESMTARLRDTLKAITRQTDSDKKKNGESSLGGRNNYGSYHAYRPCDVHDMLAKNFRPGHQHDSHELLRTVVDMMKKDQTKAFRTAIMKKFGVAKGGEGSDPKMVELVKSLDQKVKHHTFVDEIFGGELMTTQTCLTCMSIKRSHEEFLDLSLPIRVSKVNQNQKSSKMGSSFLDYSENENIVINRTVEECLSAFTEPELLTGTNVVECENCHRLNLEKLENGAAFEDVFPNAKQQQPSTTTTTESNAAGGKNNKGKRQEERKKKRPSRQARLKNQISRAGGAGENKDDTKLGPSEESESIAHANAQTHTAINLVENHFTAKDPSDGETSKSTLDDYVVLGQEDLLPNPTTAPTMVKRKLDDLDVDDCEEEAPPHLSSSEEADDQESREQEEQEQRRLDYPDLPDLELPSGSSSHYPKFKSDEGDDGDSDFPSAADGIGGSTSDCDEDNDNGVPPLGLDLPTYDKFNHFQVPSLTSSDLEEEKASAGATAADEGYSEGDNNSGENESSGGGVALAFPVSAEMKASVQSHALKTASMFGISLIPKEDLEEDEGPREPPRPLSPSLLSYQNSSSQDSVSDADGQISGSASSTELLAGEKPADKTALAKKEPPVTKCPCSRQQAISRPPEFLTIHLKRFQLNPRGYTSKLSDHVEFPLLLDLSRFCDVAEAEAKTKILDEDGQVIYSLFGIVEHSGSLHWGHYVAYVRVPAKAKEDGEMDPDSWYYISDSQVSSSSEESVIGRDPYILFYERVRGEVKRERERLVEKSLENRNRPRFGGGYFSTAGSGMSTNNSAGIDWSISSVADPPAVWNDDENWDAPPPSASTSSTSYFGPMTQTESELGQMKVDFNQTIAALSVEEDGSEGLDAIPPLEDINEEDGKRPNTVITVNTSGETEGNDNPNLNDAMIEDTETNSNDGEGVKVEKDNISGAYEL